MDLLADYYLYAARGGQTSAWAITRWRWQSPRCLRTIHTQHAVDFLEANDILAAFMGFS